MTFAAIAIIAVTIRPGVSRAAPGDLDPSFGIGGFATASLGGEYDEAQAVVVQPDGKVVAAGWVAGASNEAFALVRYNPNGSLDASFGTGGIVITPIGSGNARANALVLQADGKLVAGGYAQNGSNDDFALVRYNPDGSLDSTFGAGGRVVTPIQSGNDHINALVQQLDGKLVAAGTAAVSSLSDFALARYNTNGTLDTSFGVGGRVTMNLTSTDAVNALLLQPDGKLVTVGSSLDANGLVSQFVVTRYTTSGAVDTGFGGSGTVRTSIGTSNSYAYAAALQLDGKIVAAGTSRNGTTDDFALVRYTGSGALDLSFGIGGKVTTAIGSGADQIHALLSRPDGKLIALGYAAGPASDDYALARYNLDGTLDTTFGTGGKVTTGFGTGTDHVAAAVLQSNGFIVAAGFSAPVAQPSYNTNDDFALARYDTNGTLDASFGQGGMVTTAVGTSPDGALALLRQPDGKLVAAGYANNGTNDDFALARFNTDGSLDPSFGSNGHVVTPIRVNYDHGTAVALQPDGKIVVAGYASNGSNDDFAVVRYNPDGSLDAGFGGTGIVTTAIGSGTDRAYALVIQPDGKLVAAGQSVTGVRLAFALVQYNVDGSLDLDFGSGGKVVTPIGSSTDRSTAYALLRQPDGKLVAGGTSGVNDSLVNDDFALARYNPDGTLDATFGTAGTVKTAMPSNDLVAAMALQGDGKLVVAGSSQTTNPGPTLMAVGRYNADGSVDTSFGTDGRVTLSLGSTWQHFNALVVQPDDKLVVAGGYDPGSLTPQHIGVLARYQSDGSLDPIFGSGGIAVLNASGYVFLTGMLRQPDGKLVAAGGVNGDFGLVRADSGVVCGDGVVDPGEACDDNNAIDGDGCDSNCTVTACGNGIVTAGEQCDDGATVGGDGCSATCQLEPTPTSTVTRTATATATATLTATRTVTQTRTFTATSTPTRTATASSTRTFTATFTATPTETSTVTATYTATPTPEDTATATPADTATATFTETATDTATPTETDTATDTPTPSETMTTTATETETPADTLTPTVTDTPTNTETPLPTSTDTETSTATETATATSTATDTATATATVTATATDTATATRTATSTATATDQPTATTTATPTAVDTATATATATSTVTATPTHTDTATMTASSTPTPTSTRTATGTSTATPTRTYTPTPTATPIPTPVGPHAALFFGWTGVAKGTTRYVHHYAISGESNVEFRLPFTARVSNLLVTCVSAVTTGSHTITLRRNGGNTSVACTLQGGAALCGDTVDSVDFTAGDRISLRVANSASTQAPSCQAMATLSAIGAAPPPDSVVTLHTDAEIPANGQFCGLNVVPGTSAATCTSAGADDVSIVMPHAGTLTGLAVSISANIGNNRSETFTVRNLTTGLDTGVAVTVLAGDDNGTTTCTGNCAFNAGDRLAIRYNAVGTPQSKTRSLSISYSGAGATLTSRRGHFNAGPTYGGYHSGMDATTPGGAAVRLDRSAQLQNLYVHSTTPAVRAFTVTVCSGVTSPPSCSGIRPQCTVALGATTCADTTNTLSLLQGTYVEVQVGDQGDTTGTIGFSVEVADLPGQ